MIEDIKKILNVSKKGIVVMENGKPSYVVMPFDDYCEDMKLDALSSKSVGQGDKNEKTAQSILERELEISREEFSKMREMEFEGIFGDEPIKDGKKDNLREIRLEDLPF